MSMKSKKYLFLIILSTLVLLSSTKKELPELRIPSYKIKLSDYGFFEGKLSEQIPSSGVVPYALNAPLFSDYAYKLRFVSFPEAAAVIFNPDSVFQFPIGTALIKTFFYYQDERNVKKGRRLVETRVLLHEEKGWVALPYVWDDLQTEAYLEVAGATTQVTWRDHHGDKQTSDYLVPNMNQCKACHERNGVMTPIGPSARQLNGDFVYHDKPENQLQRWSQLNKLKVMPDDLQTLPKMANYEVITNGLDARARAYLDANCAHCHNKSGPAQSSGLFLDWNIKDSTAYGFYKTPVAAGRGSGNLSYDIVPGKPNESILLYRMESLDPGVMMPELGRHRSHVEGIKLIKDWIKSME